MKQYYHAQLDSNGVCIGTSINYAKIEDESIIEISHEDHTSGVLGKCYVDGTWIDVPQEQFIPQPTEQEIINAETLLQLAEIQIFLQQLTEGVKQNG